MFSKGIYKTSEQSDAALSGCTLKQSILGFFFFGCSLFESKEGKLTQSVKKKGHMTSKICLWVCTSECFSFPAKRSQIQESQPAEALRSFT